MRWLTNTIILVVVGSYCSIAFASKFLFYVSASLSSGKSIGSVAATRFELLAGRPKQNRSIRAALSQTTKLVTCNSFVQFKMAAGDDTIKREDLDVREVSTLVSIGSCNMQQGASHQPNLHRFFLSGNLILFRLWPLA